MSWFRAEFDKLLVATFILILSGLSLLNNEKLTAFALPMATGFGGCLLTLVVGKRGNPPDDPDPTSSESTTTTNSETKTVKPAT